MIHAGSYVRVNRKDSRFYGCVFSVLDVDDLPRYYTAYNVMNEARRGESWNYALRLDDSDELTEIEPDDPAFPESLLDQPVYVESSTKFARGDLVEVNLPTGEHFRARVFHPETGLWAQESCLVSVIRVETPEIGKVTRERWDHLTLIKHATDEVDDYITGEPIVNDDMAQQLYDNSGEVLGWVSWQTYRELGCFSTCECCDHLFFRTTHWMSRVTGYWVCYHCQNEFYTACDECGCMIHVQDAFTADDDSVFCYECADRLGYIDRDGETFIRPYSYKPRPIFHSHLNPIKLNSLFMGVELEVDGADCKESCAEDLVSQLDSKGDYFYMKNDASLTNGGFEIVTHPCTLQYHKESFPWQDIIRIVKEYHFTSHDVGTCGLHVHVNRSALGDTELQRDDTAAKIVMIFDRFWSTFVRFSRRKRYQLENYAFAPNAQIKAEDSVASAIKKSKDICTSHYCAINLSNTDTVEFRIFRGTLKYNTLIASLELVSNVVEIAKTHTATEINDLEWQDIINVNRYPELIQYLTERNMPGLEE